MLIAHYLHTVFTGDIDGSVVPTFQYEWNENAFPSMEAFNNSIVRHLLLLSTQSADKIRDHPSGDGTLRTGFEIGLR